MHVLHFNYSTKFLMKYIIIVNGSIKLVFFVTVIVSQWNMFCGSVQPIVAIEVCLLIV